MFLCCLAWKRGLPQKFACSVLFHPIKKRSFNHLCVLDHHSFSLVLSQIQFRMTDNILAVTCWINSELLINRPMPKKKIASLILHPVTWIHRHLDDAVCSLYFVNWEMNLVAVYMSQFIQLAHSLLSVIGLFYVGQVWASEIDTPSHFAKSEAATVCIPRFSFCSKTPTCRQNMQEVAKEALNSRCFSRL